MSKNSKTTLEIFYEKYPVNKIFDNAFMIAEAIGYLKAIKEYSPALENEIDYIKAELMIRLLELL